MCENMRQIRYCLIRAKVDLEYGMGFSKNEFLVDCMKEINKACEYTMGGIVMSNRYIDKECLICGDQFATDGILEWCTNECCGMDDAEISPLRWIPVSEGLPIKGERVLFSVYGFVGEGFLDEYNIWRRIMPGYRIDEVLGVVNAWMRMPAPYSIK